MKKVYLRKILESCYCKIVFIFALILFYFIVPKTIFYGYYTVLGVLFIVLSAMVVTCFIRILKEKIVNAKKYGSSFLGLISIVIGFGALQVCGIGAPICGASIGVGFLALFFPGSMINIFEDYSILIIVLSMILQIIALYFMNCFKFTR